MSDYRKGLIRGLIAGILITSVIATAVLVWLAMDAYADIAPPLWDMKAWEVIA